MDEKTCKEIISLLRNCYIPSSSKNGKPLGERAQYWKEVHERYCATPDSVFIELIQEAMNARSCTEKDILEDLQNRLQNGDRNYVRSDFAMMRTNFMCVYSKISGCNVDFSASNHEWLQASIEHRDGKHFNDRADNLYFACACCNKAVRGGEVTDEDQKDKFEKKGKKWENDRSFLRKRKQIS
jgi:hypothetical protein